MAEDNAPDRIERDANRADAHTYDHGCCENKGERCGQKWQMMKDGVTWASNQMLAGHQGKADPLGLAP
ncbi:MAG: hypothetical protein MO852_10805, partial [Candidatus Devosia euplotis]|nr:hypothetical protein [Candidatus Devosia euplotis]